jgi:ferric-dicitrate binding protein FerR (iron transport regulator)
MEERLKYLFQRYVDNSCTRREFEEFLWYVSAAENSDAIRQLIAKVYEDAGNTPSSQTYVDETGHLVLTPPGSFLAEEPVRHRPRKRLIWGLAAGTVIVLAAAYGWYQQRPAPQSNSVIAATELTRKSTERSEYKYLLLPDSTQVWLNAASTLDFPRRFEGDKRVVYLSGEAYFDVKHAEDRPFIIQTGKVTTTVLGTAFNIKAYPGRKDVIVSVSRGKVKVNFDDQEVATLTKGQQVKVSNTDSRIVEKKPVANEPASWQQGMLAYDDEYMEDIIADLERVYDVQIGISDSSLLQLRVSTGFKREIGVEMALQVLCELTDTKLKQANGRYTIQ